MQSFEQKDPRGEKLFKKPEYIKPPPSDKQKLSSATKKIESITEIVDLERESLIKTIEKLKNKANIVELILNHGSLTGKMILKHGIIIDVSLDEYAEIEAIIYLIQITEEDLLSYLPMFLKKKLEDENLLDTLESMIKYRPQDIRFEIEMEEALDKTEEKKIDNLSQQKESSVSLDDLDKEIEALLLEIDKKEDTPTKKEQKINQMIEETVMHEIPENQETETIPIEKIDQENEIVELQNVYNEEQNLLEIVEEKNEYQYLEEKQHLDEYQHLDEQIIEIIEKHENEIKTTEDITNSIFVEEKIEETFDQTTEQIESIIKDKHTSKNIEEGEIREIKKEEEYKKEENITTIRNIEQESKKVFPTREEKRTTIKTKEESKIMVIDNIVSKLSQIPPLEEFHIINTETEELEYCSNESLDDFSISTIVAVYKDLSMFSGFSSERINNMVVDTDNSYYVITNIDDTRILLSKCSKKANPSLISSLISKAIKGK
ncbi:MAG: hypothetical protein NZM44_02730 [Candidatus Calescibacterium sp.]|nr:hypothetical protein [Candidatus Calescibacterium sp.]